jgi:hypothetical protein
VGKKSDENVLKKVFNGWDITFSSLPTFSLLFVDYEKVMKMWAEKMLHTIKTFSIIFSSLFLHLPHFPRLFITFSSLFRKKISAKKKVTKMWAEKAQKT